MFGLPPISLGGPLSFQGLGETGSLPNFRIVQVHQYLDNLSWTRGNHSLKVGVDVRWNRSDALIGGGSHGGFSFSGNFTRASMADYLLGWTTGATLSTITSANLRVSQLHVLCHG